MTAADPESARLDPQHVLAVCTRATGGDPGVQAARTEDGIRVSFQGRRAAWTAASALGRTGYSAAVVSTDRTRRDLLVTGWDADRLDSRLAALRTVMHHLADNPLLTATAAVRRFAVLPLETPAAAAASILKETRQQLRNWVDTRAGICTAAPPAVLPARTALAMRVRAAASCEEVISDLIGRHIRVADHAVTLFASLRGQMNDSRAERTAVRRAGVFFHLGGDSLAQDSAPLMTRTTAPRPPTGGAAADPASRTRRPRQGMAGEFPAPPGAANPPGAGPAAGRSGPGGQGFPAARPGRRR